MVESPDRRHTRQRSSDHHHHHHKPSLHTPPNLFPGVIDSTNFKRARTTSPPTSVEEGGSENEAEALLVSTPPSEADSTLGRRGESSGPTIVHQTPLRHSFGMSSMSTVDGLSKKMHNITVPDRPGGPEQASLVKESSKAALESGQSWFLVDRKWYRLWSTACSEEPSGKDSDALEVGPVETKDLLEAGQLKQGLGEGVDFEWLSAEAWRLLTSWYGLQDPPIERRVIQIPSSDSLRLELYPPRLLLTTLGEIKTSFSASFSILATLGELKKASMEHISSLQTTTTELDLRFWRLPLDQGDEATFTPSLEAAGVELISEEKEDSTTLAELQIDQPVERLAVEIRKNGSPWAYSANGKAAPSVKGIFRQDGGEYLSRMQAGKRSADEEGAGSSASSSNAGRVTRSQTAVDRGSEKQRGLTGLYNLGNTCFMNSALQCMSNTKELKDYFVSGVYKAEVNTDNPLGMGGAMAKIFGELLSKLWGSGGGAWHPREFKTVLSRFAPQFIGYSQQDSQELLAFVLDGLHEDLNRIVKKPYIEAPDWEGGGTREMVAFAHRQWEIYKMRNDSVIVDLFQGQYRSTLVCPDCAKVSIKFDPFMYLTLPIPNRKSYSRKIIYIPWSRENAPIEVQMRFTGETSIQKLKKNLGEWFNADANRMVACDVFSKTFYRIYGDFENATEIGTSDVTFIYELPTAMKPVAPTPSSNQHYHRREHLTDLEKYTKTKFDASIGEEMAILPVFSTTKRADDYLYRSSRGGSFGQPFFVAIAKDDVHDEEVIRRAVMDKYMQYTGNPAALKQYLDNIEEEVETPPEDWDMLNDTPSSIVLPDHNGATIETVAEIHDGGETVHIVPDLPPQEMHKVHPEKAAAAASLKTSKRGPSMHFVVNREDHSPLTLKPDGYEDYGEELQKRSTRLAASWLEASNSMDTDGDSTKASSWPLVYTGGALVCAWPEKVKEKVFGDDENLWAGGPSRATFVDPELEAERNTESGGKKVKATITIDDCLNEFTKEEQLGESDPWYCPRCKDFKQATKKFDLWKVPDILVVHLKRFSSGRMSRDKIDSFIDFPVSGLDLTDRVEGAKAVAELHADEQDDEKLMESIGSLGADDDAVESDAPLYDLYAVDNHYGGLGGGHYTAFAKNPEDDKWYYFDDSSVRSVSNPDEVKGQAAYLLFYRRRTTRPIGGKSREKVREKVKSEGEGEMESAHRSIQGQVSSQEGEPDDDTLPGGFSGSRDDQAKLSDDIAPLHAWGQVEDDDMQVLPPYSDTNGWDAIPTGGGVLSRASSGSLAASLGDVADGDSGFGADNGSISSLNDDPPWSPSGHDSSSNSNRPIKTFL
jgi:ubiquitin carboxyl-terminal hydrolase 4/11/15